MNRCDPDNLTAYVDGVLSGSAALAMEAHLSVCPACAATVRDHQMIQQRLVNGAGSVVIPTGLAGRIGFTLDRLPPPRSNRVSRWRGTGLPLSVAAVVTAAGLWFAKPMWTPRPMDVQAIVFHHTHTSNPPPGLSLATANSATASAWLKERLKQDAPVPAITLPLKGVGVCQVADEPAAIWMYGGAKPVTFIDIFAREAPPAWHALSTSSGVLRTGSYGRYNVVVWQGDGHSYAMVSELPPQQLLGLLEHCR